MTFQFHAPSGETFAESQARWARWARRYWERRREAARAAPCPACGRRGDEHPASQSSPRFASLCDQTLVLLPAAGEAPGHEPL